MKKTRPNTRVHVNNYAHCKAQNVGRQLSEKPSKRPPERQTTESDLHGLTANAPHGIPSKPVKRSRLKNAHKNPRVGKSYILKDSKKLKCFCLNSPNKSNSHICKSQNSKSNNADVELACLIKVFSLHNNISKVNSQARSQYNNNTQSRKLLQNITWV